MREFVKDPAQEPPGGAAPEPTGDEPAPDRPMAEATPGDESDSDAVTEATEPFEAEPPDDGGSRPGVLTLFIALVTALVVLAAGAVGYLGYRLHRAEQVDDARAASLAAAQVAAEAFLSYDYRELDQSFEAARAHLIGDEAKEYEETAETVEKLAPEYKAVLESKVVEGSVVSAERDKAVILLFVNQTITSNRLEAPKVDSIRLRLTAVKSDGRWLISNADAH